MGCGSQCTEASLPQSFKGPKGSFLGFPAAMLLQQDLPAVRLDAISWNLLLREVTDDPQMLEKGNSAQIFTMSGSRYFVRSAEPAGGSAATEMVDERDTSTWPAVLQVTVFAGVLCLICWQCVTVVVDQWDTSKALTIL